VTPTLVLDCSAACALCFEDEANAQSERVLELLDQGQALVPALFFWEVANVLLMAQRRGRLSQAERVEALQLFEAQDFAVDPADPAVIWHDVIHLAERCQLTSYDAAYLELAMRSGLPLASHDRALRAAAQSLGIRLLNADPTPG
jgi:predicted nucleic acid-binding protein